LAKESVAGPLNAGAMRPLALTHVRTVLDGTRAYRATFPSGYTGLFRDSGIGRAFDFMFRVVIVGLTPRDRKLPQGHQVTKS